jgi:NADH-quinone oxidoreductase subunit J
MGALSLLGFGTVISVIYNHVFPVREVTRTPIEVEEIGKGLLSYTEGGYILPFEVISILLLAAMIGAIIISKGKRNI